MFFKVVGRITANFLQGLGKGFYTFFRWIGKHPLGFIFTVVAIVGVCVAIWGFNLFGIADGTFLSSNTTVVKPTERTLEPDGKSVEFLNALKDGNATKIYDTFSNDLKNKLKENGVTSAGVMQTILNDQLEQATNKKNTKLNYQFSFVIGTKYSDGSVEDGFTAQINGSSRNNLQYIFRIKGGKIQALDSSDPIVIALLGTNKTDDKANAQVGAMTNNRNPNAEKFMVGLTTYNADQMWDVIADGYKEELKARGVTRDTIAKFFDVQIKKYNENQPAKGGQKVGYDGFVYFRTINFPNGITSHTYSSILSIGDNPLQPGYTLILDKENKIIKIGTEGPADPILSGLLGRKQQ